MIKKDNMKNTVIFDLDGTLALIDKRRALAGVIPGAPEASNPQMNWKVFLDPENIFLDEPNIPVIKMAQLLHSQGFKIVIFSGRTKATYRTTRQWLIQNDVPFDELHMRPNDRDDGGHWHFMSDNKLKQHWLDTLVDKDDIFAVFDDRQQVVDMWRSNGLTCFQVADGDF
tara:strand:- start:125 stop:634 length:510 start_codon:yes stop_codon:yes gene_type:complete